MPKSDPDGARFALTRDGHLMPRRAVLRGGLASLAAALAAPLAAACDTASSPDGGLDSGLDAGALPEDAFVPPDAGPYYFPAREIPAPAPLISRIAEIGALGEPDENGLRLPDGFTGRVVARSQVIVEGTSHTWHLLPDGGATFATEDGGWILVVNSESPLDGGAGAIRFSADGAIVSAASVLTGTRVNCGGGPTPWHTWLSGEEHPRGLMYECDPWGEAPSVARPALGVFKHEAVTVDRERGHLYLTEDVPDGGFYRFVPDAMTPDGHPDLNSGTLEIATVDVTGAVTWAAVPDPQRTGELATRRQVAGSTPFDGGEGIVWHAGVVYFSTKGDTRVWRYDTAAASMDVLYDGEALAEPPLTGVDNLTVTCCGDVLVAEDGGSMQVVAILPDGSAKPLVQVVGQDTSEITGPAFDPSGTRLYFSSQRGTNGAGLTYEVTGPFHAPV